MTDTRKPEAVILQNETQRHALANVIASLTSSQPCGGAEEINSVLLQVSDALSVIADYQRMLDAEKQGSIYSDPQSVAGLVSLLSAVTAVAAVAVENNENKLRAMRR